MGKNAGKTSVECPIVPWKDSWLENSFRFLDTELTERSRALPYELRIFGCRLGDFGTVNFRDFLFGCFYGNAQLGTDDVG